MPRHAETVQRARTSPTGAQRAQAAAPQAGAIKRTVVMTPIGELLLVARAGAVCEIRLPDPATGLPLTSRPGGRAPRSQEAADPLARPRSADAPDAPLATDAPLTTDAVLEAARRQLGEYFAGRRREFDLPLLFEGTEFQRRVWGALRAVGYGETVTYAQLARAVGRPGAARAVGAALASNPLPLVLPCHRVIGTRGDLRGFGGGIARKRYLLEAETANLGS